MSIDDINQAIVENPNILCDGWKLLPSGKWRNSCHVIREGMPRATGGQGSYIYPNIPVIFDGADSDTRMSFAAFYAQLHHLPFHHGDKTSEQINDNHRVWHELAGLVGGDFKYDRKEDDDYRTRQEKLSSIQTLYNDSVNNMSAPTGAETGRVDAIRAYFGQVRGWSDELIERAGIGALRASKAAEYNLDPRFNVVIPVICDGMLVGLKFRNLNDTNGDRYRNMVGARLTDFAYIGKNKKTAGTAYLCEGEFDAIRMRLAGGLPCFASQGGANMSDHTKLLGIKQRGWTALVIIADNDANGKGAEYALTAALEAEKVGLEARVVERLSDDCKDADEFLRGHTIQELYDRLNAAKPFAISAAERLINGSGSYYHEFFGMLSTLYTSVRPHWHKSIDDIILANNDRLIELYNVYAKDVIAELSDTEKQERDREREEALRKAASLYEDAAKLLRNGDVKAASVKIEKANNEREYAEDELMDDEDEGNDFDNTFINGTETQYIWTNIELRVPNVQDDAMGNIKWGVPIGGITSVCARTGHGKSRFLENVVIDASEQLPKESCIMYFALEEKKINIYSHLVSIVCNRALSYQANISNINIIKGFAKGYVLNDIGDERGKDILNDAINRIDAKIHMNISSKRTDAINASYKEELKDRTAIAVDYVRGMCASRRLIIKDDITNIEDVIEKVKRAARKRDVKLIIIDYLQLFDTEDRTSDAKQRMSAICKKLIALKKDCDAAIVCAAQLNRQVTSPLKMDVGNISDASDIEHCCDEVMFLFNSTFNFTGNDWETYDRDGKERLEGMGFTYGTPGTIYIRNVKSRSWMSGGEAVIKYNGRIGTLWQSTQLDANGKSDIADMGALIKSLRERREGTILLDENAHEQDAPQGQMLQEQEETKQGNMWHDNMVQENTQQDTVDQYDVWSDNGASYNSMNKDNDDTFNEDYEGHDSYDYDDDRWAAEDNNVPF